MIIYEENALTPESMNAIRTAVGWSAYSRARLEQAISMTRYSVIARQEGRPIGMVRLIGDGIYYFLCDVAVIPDAQQHGIGRRMVQILLARVRQDLAAGERCSITLVSAEGKEPFYASFGFASIPNTCAGYGMQLFLTAKT